MESGWAGRIRAGPGRDTEPVYSPGNRQGRGQMTMPEEVMSSDADVVTGSFSYTGQHIARRLLAAGRQVRTLTGHPQPSHPLAGQVTVFPYDFDQPDRLVETLRGADTLYNTYWVRFPHGHLNYEVGVRNLLLLIQAAVEAGVRKIVHVSIINPSEDSPYAYFRGKARVERAIQESGL